MIAQKKGSEPGCYGEGTYGHQHTRLECADALRSVVARAPSSLWSRLGTQIAPLLLALHADMSDDASEETEACDWLNEHAPLEGHWWGWRDGDFGLWPEDDRETDPNLCDRWEQP